MKRVIKHCGYKRLDQNDVCYDVYMDQNDVCYDVYMDQNDVCYDVYMDQNDVCYDVYMDQNDVCFDRMTCIWTRLLKKVVRMRPVCLLLSTLCVKMLLYCLYVIRAG